MRKSITQQIEEHVANALDTLAGKDKVEWLVVPAIGPQQQVIHFVNVVIPSPLLGQSIQSGGIMTGTEVKGEAISQLIQQALEQCRETRSNVLKDALTAQAPISAGEVVLPQ